MVSAGIYLHIPFCRTKCIYCDFYSLPGRDEAIPRFVKTIVEEINRCPVDTGGWVFDTLFIGGGTPSILEPKQVEMILQALSRRFDISGLREITIEANPGEAPEEKLRAFLSLGINRLSLGVQSLEPDLLRFLTRIHDAEAVYTTFRSARKAGFDNINCDLIFAIPGQTIHNWESDLKRITNLGPEHLSIYSLTVEEGTRLHRLVNSGAVAMPTDEESVNRFYSTMEFLAERGFHPYEISNYAVNGKECRHNLHYWTNDPYLGFGPSAHSYDGRQRWRNIPDLDYYMEQIESHQSPVIDRYTLSPREKINEILGFGIRMSEGANLALIPDKYRVRVNTMLDEILEKWEGYLKRENDRLFLTRKGLSFADAIAVDLMLDENPGMD
ncbi:MAG: radical SAM family heme chaperone HemW [FCB group bacterium]|nr:radical SAM family heme chaperone HemW [FCB group bacterium]